MSCGHWFESLWEGGLVFGFGRLVVRAFQALHEGCPVGKAVGDDLSGLERNEDHKVQFDICERQAAVVCGVNEAYDGGVGALERRDECRPSQPPVLRAWVGGPARRGHAHAASDCIGGCERRGIRRCRQRRRLIARVAIGIVEHMPRSRRDVSAESV